MQKKIKLKKNPPRQKVNYDKQMLEIVEDFKDMEEQPKMFIHSCCAPCSSAVIKKIAPYFQLTVFYYNPNIDGESEYDKRAKCQQRLIEIYNEEKVSRNPIKIFELGHSKEDFTDISDRLGEYEEGGLRCMRCFHLRLKRTLDLATEMGFDYYCTTLTVSPHKNARIINQIGSYLANDKVKWLPNDFKKRNGYLDSVNLSKKLGLYRQCYCGCKHSRLESEEYRAAKALENSTQFVAK